MQFGYEQLAMSTHRAASTAILQERAARWFGAGFVNC